MDLSTFWATFYIKIILVHKEVNKFFDKIILYFYGITIHNKSYSEPMEHVKMKNLVELVNFPNSDLKFLVIIDKIEVTDITYSNVSSSDLQTMFKATARVASIVENNL